MMWVYMATGFMGACTLLYLLRILLRSLGIVASLRPLFAPNGDYHDAIVAELNRARHEVLMQSYALTVESIVQALVEAKKRGAHVQIVLDKRNEAEAYSELHPLIEHGLAPLIDAGHPAAQDNIIIIDQKVLITCSFDFTERAEVENAGNVLILKGHADVIEAYRQNFMCHKAHSKQAAIRQGHDIAKQAA